MSQKYSYSNWSKRSGTIPVQWQASDYQDHKWKTNHDKRGYSTKDENYKIYNDRLGVHILDYEKQGEGIFIPESMKKVFDYVPGCFDLDKIIYSFMKYPVGNILPWHRDNYPTYCKNNGIDDVESIVRIVVLLSDGKPGQQLWIEDMYCNGPAGSWFSWEGSTEHMAANLGTVPRYALQITGVKPSR